MSTPTSFIYETFFLIINKCLHNVGKKSSNLFKILIVQTEVGIDAICYLYVYLLI